MSVISFFCLSFSFFCASLKEDKTYHNTEICALNVKFYASFSPIVAVAGGLSVVAYLTPPPVARPTQWRPLSRKRC